ncbi:MAG: ATP/maltotriose-dependent transcriptional regulator MalT [Cognaticolwellia sp.]|jgi:ATP/maltotriose-dependent transcriptional regulator MalT
MVNIAPPSSLNTTEIYPPEYRGYIETHSFKTELAQVQQNKLTIIQAPAGYGKTVYLAGIYHHVKHPTAWISIRESDNDPINLITKLMAAIKLTDQSVNTSFINQVGSIPSASLYPLVNLLIGELEKSNLGYILFNDIDVLVAPLSIDIVNRLINSSRSSIRFAVSCCTQPDIAYAELLLRGDVRQIQQSTLKFLPADTRALFALKGVESLEQTLIERLTELTEGWPSAIQFVSSVVTNNEQFMGLIDDLIAGEKTIASYFTERVFKNQSQQAQELMVALSLIDRFNASLCFAITDSQTSNQQLNELIESNIFIAAIDKQQKWFRFHQLFNQYLRNRAIYDITPEQQHKILVNAGKWFYQQGFFSDAIGLLLKAKEVDQVSQCLVDCFIPVVKQQGKHALYLGWVETLPAEQLDKYPKLRLNYLVVLCLTKRFQSTKTQISLVLNNINAFTEELKDLAERDIGIVLLMMAGLQDNIDGLYMASTQWLARWGAPELYSDQHEYHFDIGIANLLKGFSCKCLGLFDEGKQAFFKASEHLSIYGSDFALAWSRGLTAVMYAKQGFHYEAFIEAEEALIQTRKNLGQQSYPGFMLAALLAAIKYENDDLSTARDYIADGIYYIKEQSATDMLIASYSTKARLYFVDIAIKEGVALLKNGIKWADSNNLNRLKFTLLNELMVWLSRNERIKEAEDYARYYGIVHLNNDQLDITITVNKIVSDGVIRILMAHQKYDDASMLLTKLIALSRKNKNIYQLAQRLKLMAMVRFKQEDVKEAARVMLESLELSYSRNYRRLYLDEGSAIVKVLNIAYAKIPQGAVKPFTRCLLDKLESSGIFKQAYWEPLTTRETDIVRRLKTGLLNKEIATQIFISEGTLKWHLHNIYSKLEVKNRTQAIKVAQEREFL